MVSRNFAYPRLHRYWDGEKEALSAHSSPFNGTREDAKTLLGCFLSGGTDHHEVHGSAQEAAKLVPELARVWDEPFADPSQVPSL